ncbi:MAG: carboxypeptidase regulatory-like domain-containing protein [Rhodothermales bacterium]
MLLRRCALVLLTCLALPAQAQEAAYSLALRDVPLEQALEELVALTDISLVYGDEIGAERTFCRRTDASAEALLRCIVESAGLDFYQLSSGTYVVIERAEQVPQYGSLAGIVVDGDTGEPLPGASVLLADASAGMAANAAGMFTFSALEPGPYRVTASFIGYEPVAERVWVPADGRARHRIALRPKPFAASPVVVDGLQQRAPSALPGQSDLSAAESQAATLGPADAARSARTLLGIADRPLLADLSIQGGEAGEHVTTLDGAPVFDPVSLGRVLTAFSPLAVERLTVRKAGFGAAHGSYTAGVVEIDQALGNGPLAATAQLDPYSANVHVGGGSANVAAMAAARTSLWSLYRPGTLDAALRHWNDIDPLLISVATPSGGASDELTFQPHRHGSDVAFTDLHAAVRVKLGPFRTLRASAYRGSNEVETELLAAGFGAAESPEQLTLSRDRYRWTNTTGRVRVESLLGARALGYAGVRASHHTLAHGYQALDAADIGYAPETGSISDFETALRDALAAEPLPDDGNRFTEWVAEAGLDYSLSPTHLVEVGVEGAVVDHAFHLDNPYLRPLRSASTLGRVAAFVTDRVHVSRRTTLEAGLRMTWVPDRAAVYAEPRVALRYDAERGPVGPYAVRLAAGLYRQFVNQFDVTSVGPSAIVPSVRFWLPVDASLMPPRALHLAAEGFAAPAAGWTVRGETYYKHLPHLLALDYGALLDHSASFEADAAQASFIGAARGFAYGGGARLERETGRVRLGLGYDYSYSRRTFPSRFDGRTQPAPWNQPHRLQLSADLDLGTGFVTRLRGRGVWGRTWGYRQAYYDFLAFHGNGGEIGLPEERALPALYEVDLGVGYSRRVAGTSVALTVDVLNVLDRANVLDYSLRPVGEGFEAVARTGLGIQPVVTLRVGL